MNNPASQQGMVLVMALLYLSVVTLLVLGVSELGVLQIKMAANLTDEAQALQNAETALIAGEAAVKGNELTGEGKVNTGAIYRFTKRPESACDVSYYQVDATGIYARAKSELESILSLPTGANDCSNTLPKREEVAWKQIL